MSHIAILGFGTVGSGVAEVLAMNQNSIEKKAARPIRLKRVFDLREFPGHPVEKLLTHNIEDVFNDEAIDIIVETMGGVEPAYTFAKRAILSGRAFVTSNKELVAKHGAELLELAKQNSTNFLFEASVAGAIPIIRPLSQSLTSEEIYEITGILNGTTNYILTKMTDGGQDFEESLRQAQAFGYAERDSSADVDGFDTCRKIAILMSLALGKQVNYEDIRTEGIAGVTPADIAYAAKMGAKIKLLATAKRVDNPNSPEYYSFVAPVIVPNVHPLATVADVFNAVFVKGNVIDEVMFYGRGAGRLPTAGAVVADVIDCAKHTGINILYFWATEKFDIMPAEKIPSKKLLRFSCTDTECVKEVAASFGIGGFVELDGCSGEIGMITPVMPESEIYELIGKITAIPEITGFLSAIRIYF